MRVNPHSVLARSQIALWPTRAERSKHPSTVLANSSIAVVLARTGRRESLFRSGKQLDRCCTRQNGKEYTGYGSIREQQRNTTNSRAKWKYLSGWLLGDSYGRNNWSDNQGDLGPAFFSPAVAHI